MYSTICSGTPSPVPARYTKPTIHMSCRPSCVIARLFVDSPVDAVRPTRPRHSWVIRRLDASLASWTLPTQTRSTHFPSYLSHASLRRRSRRSGHSPRPAQPPMPTMTTCFSNRRPAPPRPSGQSSNLPTPSTFPLPALSSPLKPYRKCWTNPLRGPPLYPARRQVSPRLVQLLHR